MYKVEDMKNCPFCDSEVYDWNKDYFACCHTDDCFMVTGVNKDSRTMPNVKIILKRKDYVDAWNKRADLFEDWEPVITCPTRDRKKVKCRIIKKSELKPRTLPGEFADENEED